MSEWIDDVDAYEVMGTRNESDGTLPGNMPTASVTIAVARESAVEARNVLLGGRQLPLGSGTPRTWPYLSIDTLYCVGAARRNVQGDFQAVNEEKLNTDWVFLDLQYTARLGRYIVKPNEHRAYYVEDSLEPRFESRPLNHSHYEWATLLGTDTTRHPISSNEAPVKSLSGFTLLHKVSGFLNIPNDIESYIGTTARASVANPGIIYTSQNLGKQFAESPSPNSESTLLLRTVNIVQEYSHNSYLFNQPTFTLICRYEFKAEGWNRFWRPLLTATGGYDYIRNTKTGVNQTFFPPEDHSAWLF